MGFATWKYHPETGIVEWDNQMHLLYGIDPKGFPGVYEAWESTLTPETKQKVIEDLQAALAGQKEFNSEFEIKLPSGEIRTIAGRGTVIRNPKGEAIRMIGFNWDVTEERKVERDLKIANERLQIYKAVLDHAPDFIGIADKTATPIYVNPADRRLVGIAEDADITKTIIGDYYPEDLRDTIVPKIVSEMVSDGEWQGETFFRNFQTNERIPVSDLHFKVKSPQGEILCFATITRDISKDKQLQSELETQRLNALRNAKLASLGELSASIAHEINNPLTIIDGSAQLLPKFFNNPEKLNAKIEIVMKSCERISHIVKGLKKFARTSELSERKDCSIYAITKEAISLVLPKSKIHSIPINLHVTCDALVRCNEIEIEQVLVNLISNSIDAIRERLDRWIEVSISEESESVVLKVKDSGHGIPDSVRQKMFNPFFTTKKVGEGTGLGLSIVKGILDEHGASISLDTACPNTCFEIRFPRAG